MANQLSREWGNDSQALAGEERDRVVAVHNADGLAHQKIHRLAARRVSHLQHRHDILPLSSMLHFLEGHLEI